MKLFANFQGTRTRRYERFLKLISDFDQNVLGRRYLTSAGLADFKNTQFRGICSRFRLFIVVYVIIHRGLSRKSLQKLNSHYSATNGMECHESPTYHG